MKKNLGPLKQQSLVRDQVMKLTHEAFYFFSLTEQDKIKN